MTTTYATARTPLTKADFHYSNNDINFFKLRSRAQEKVPMKPGPQWDIEQAPNNNKKGAIDKGADGGYADFQFKKCDMKEKGAGGYALFRKNPGAAGGYADFQLKKCDMKEKGAGGYAVFRKTPGAAGGYADLQFKKCDMKEKGAGGYAVFGKPVIQKITPMIFLQNPP